MKITLPHEVFKVHSTKMKRSWSGQKANIPETEYLRMRTVSGFYLNFVVIKIFEFQII
jgi:hypothetical protein